MLPSVQLHGGEWGAGVAEDGMWAVCNYPLLDREGASEGGREGGSERGRGVTCIKQCPLASVWVANSVWLVREDAKHLLLPCVFAGGGWTCRVDNA